MKVIRRLAVIATTSLVATTLWTGSIFASDNGVLHKPVWEAHPPIHIKNGATTTYQDGYSPEQIRGAYGLSKLPYDGSGITLAIVDAYGSPTIQQDLDSFSKQFSLPSSNLNVVNLAKRTDSSWALETSLDVEWMHALAPGATILLIEARSASLSDLLSGVDYATKHGAQVVSMSWGGNEFSGETKYERHFNNSSIVYVASSGDHGVGVQWPAVSPNVVSVGGTTLTLSGSNWSSETAWSKSGGGSSAYEGVPSYQAGLNLSGRGVPDVALDADLATGVAVYDSTSHQGQSGWFQMGGTSFCAPAWAAIIGEVDQALSRNAYDSSSLLTALYADFHADSYNSYFHDITNGSNGIQATSGYDLVTGIGSPLANNLVPQLITQASTISTSGSTPGSGHIKK